MQRRIVEPMTVLFIRQELTIPEVGSYGEKFGAAIMAEVKQHNLQVIGPWLYISYNLPKNGKDRYVVDFCLPVQDASNYSGRQVAVKTLDSFSCACTTYTGKLRQLFTKGYQPLVQEIIAAGDQFSGESREVYHSWSGSNSADNCIELQFGVSR